MQHIFDAPVPFKSWTGEDTISRVVVIARDMTEEELRRSLDMLLLKPDDSDDGDDGVPIAGMFVEATEMPF